MTAVRYSKNAFTKIMGQFSGALIIVIGLFAVFFSTTPRFSQQGNAEPHGLGVVHADAPPRSCSDSSCSTCADSAGCSSCGDGSADSGCDGCCDSP